LTLDINFFTLFGKERLLGILWIYLISGVALYMIVWIVNSEVFPMGEFLSLWHVLISCCCWMDEEDLFYVMDCINFLYIYYIDFLFCQ
jgi:hypothetical protein